MEIPLRYRRDPRDEMFETAEDEYVALRQFVQETMRETTPELALDTLLMLANIFEQRAQTSITHPLRTWYSAMAFLLRRMLYDATHLSLDAPLPNVSLENQSLYWDTPAQMH